MFGKRRRKTMKNKMNRKKCVLPFGLKHSDDDDESDQCGATGFGVMMMTQWMENNQVSTF